MKIPRTRPIKPKEYEIPDGFVDAFGLDCDSIPYKPFIITVPVTPAPDGGKDEPQAQGPEVD